MAIARQQDRQMTVTARLTLPTLNTERSSTPFTMSTHPISSCRRQTLKVINTRPVLIAICTFVVIECACVLSELMVDLQGIKFRFENEEKELNRFVEFLKTKYPEEVSAWKDASSVEDIINIIKDSLIVRSDKDIAAAAAAASAAATCSCPCSALPPESSGGTSGYSQGTGRRKESIQPDNNNNDNQNGGSFSNSTKKDSSGPKTVPGPPSASITNSTSRSGATYAQFNPEDVFVLEINNVKDSFFLVAEYAAEHIQLNETKHHHYETAYMRIHKASTALHITSLVILSFMVIETITKFVCMGTAFLKKRFEVFDAFIVISSFALDFVFLDSRWYETGKDAATVLVLLLPWRVVRIVNSFLMTVKHKHHIAIMTIKRAKKRADFKNAKLQTLLSEIRKDVQLLVALCRNNDLPENDITACLYGLGRRSTTLNAVTSCTTIMLVSALGKDASLEDEIYGRLFADALRDPAEHDNEPEAKKAEEEAIDAAIELDKQMEQQSRKAARASKPRHSSSSKQSRAQVTRSYTVPRRSASIDHTLQTPNSNNTDNDGGNCDGSGGGGGGDGGGGDGDIGTIFYVNDAFATHRTGFGKKGMVPIRETLAGLPEAMSSCQPVTEELTPDAQPQKESENGQERVEVVAGGAGGGGKDSWEGRVPPKCKSKASVRSLSGPAPGQNYVTFEVTTQVTYL